MTDINGVTYYSNKTFIVVVEIVDKDGKHEIRRLYSKQGEAGHILKLELKPGEHIDHDILYPPRHAGISRYQNIKKPDPEKPTLGSILADALNSMEMPSAVTGLKITLPGGEVIAKDEDKPS